ncbi:MAG: hypothetical protein ACXV7G_11360 [Halobacteriota archaeon]
MRRLSKKVSAARRPTVQLLFVRKYRPQHAIFRNACNGDDGLLIAKPVYSVKYLVERSCPVHIAGHTVARNTVLLFAVVVLGLGLRLYHLSTLGLW